MQVQFLSLALIADIHCMATKYSNLDIEKHIKESVSWRQVCLKLNLKYAGGNVQQLKKKAEKLNITYNHFKGKGWNIGDVAKNAKPIEDCLQNSVFIKPSNLKKKLIKANLLVEKCYACNMGPIWNSKPLVLELDHIDGNSLNNRLENLRLLCPNCHSQTPTFRGRNAK